MPQANLTNLKGHKLRILLTSLLEIVLIKATKKRRGEGEEKGSEEAREGRRGGEGR
jgi:hypothetical protein